MNKSKSLLSIADDMIILSVIDKNDYSDYQNLFCENLTSTIQKYVKNHPDFKRSLFDDLLKKESLYYTIRKSETLQFLGYCGIKDISSKNPEIAIELTKPAQHQGFGTRAMKLLLQAYVPQNNFEYYRYVVAPDNYPSQRLCEKIGGIPNGIIALIIKEPKIQEIMEEHNLNMINDRLRQIAKKFGVEPRKLLSHFLEYKIYT